MSFAPFNSDPVTINPVAVLEQWAMMFLLARGQSDNFGVVANSVGPLNQVIVVPELDVLTPAWAIYTQDTNVYLYVNGTTLVFREGLGLAAGAVNPAFFPPAVNVLENRFMKSQREAIFTRIRVQLTLWNQRGYRLHIVGYSQGAVVGLTIGMLLRSQGWFGPWDYLGFASPRPFTDSRNILNLPINGWVVFNAADPIPQISPNNLLYTITAGALIHRAFGSFDWRHCLPAVQLNDDGTSTLLQPTDFPHYFNPLSLQQISSQHLPPVYSRNVAHYYRTFRGI